MKIQINKFWQNTRGVRVEAGEYEASDLPVGIAQYLVDNDHAVVIESVEDDENPKSIPSAERAKLEAEYERLYDRKPSSQMKTETLVQRIAEALADDTD